MIFATKAQPENLKAIAATRETVHGKQDRIKTPNRSVFLKNFPHNIEAFLLISLLCRTRLGWWPAPLEETLMQSVISTAAAKAVCASG